MAPKIFITGVTGYIAGDATHALYKAHPNYEYTALVRTREKANLVQKAFPKLRVVIGDLDNAELLKEESAKADVVLHAADASDNAGAAHAIAAGLASTHTAQKPGYWLHTGGTGILTFTDAQSGRLGEWTDKQYNDWSNVSEITTLPDDAFHRNVDKIVLAAGQQQGVKTAIVCPPTIYGRGRGPVSGRGRQVYELAKLILTGKYIPIIGSGHARWNHVHISDLSDVYVLLVDAAVNGTHNASDESELWGEKGYYFIESGEHVWGELAETIGRKAEELGLVGGVKLEKRALDREKAIEQAGFEAESWGLNSRSKGERAREVLGWSPHAVSFEEEVPEILRQESERLKEA